MFIVRDKPPSFDEVAGHVVQSVVPIAVGTRLEDDAPNIIGTGFALEWAENFATCWHVARLQDKLAKLSDPELEKEGLKDAVLRIALRRGTDYIWREVEPKTWFRAQDEVHDVCIYRVVGVAAPPLRLRTEAGFTLGAEVGIIGFPMGNTLQGDSLRPYVLKTVISGGLEMTGDDGTTRIPRLALGTAVAGGFSGGPVFLASDGEVVGMIASKMMEGHKEVVWPAGISLAVPPNILKSDLDGLLRSSTDVIKDSLRKHLP